MGLLANESASSLSAEAMLIARAAAKRTRGISLAQGSVFICRTPAIQ